MPTTKRPAKKRRTRAQIGTGSHQTPITAASITSASRARYNHVIGAAKSVPPLAKRFASREAQASTSAFDAAR